MNDILKSFYNDPFVEAIGWTLFHSLWQITIIVILLVILFIILKNYTAKTRYAIASLAMTTCLLWSSITFASSFHYAKDKQTLSLQIKIDKLTFKKQLYNSLKQELKEEQKKESLHKKASIKPNIIRFRGLIQRSFPLMIILWFIGMGLFIIRLSGALLYLQKQKSKFTSKVDESIEKLALLIAGNMGVKRSFKIIKSGVAGTSMIVGHLKPVILLPFSMITQLSIKELEAVLAHEIAHLKRNDFLINILQSIIEAIFFFHPGMWVISKAIRTERENSCDEIAIKVTNDKINYLKALTHAWELSNDQNTNYKVAFTAKHSSLLQRALRIKNNDKMKKNVTEGFIVASIIFFTLILFSFSFDNQNLKTETYTTSQTNNASSIKKFSNVKLDSITKSITAEELPEELNQAIEIAYTNKDTALAILIDDVIKEVKSEININSILHEVQASIKESHINEEIKKGFEEAYAELDDSPEDSIQIAKASLELTQSTLDSIDVESIVIGATQAATEALETIHLENILKDALKTAEEALRQIDYNEIKEEINNAMYEIDVNDIKNDIYESLEDVDLEEIRNDIKVALNEIQIEKSINTNQQSYHSENYDKYDNKSSEKERDLEELLREMEKDE